MVWAWQGMLGRSEVCCAVDRVWWLGARLGRSWSGATRGRWGIDAETRGRRDVMGGGDDDVVLVTIQFVCRFNRGFNKAYVF